MQRMIHFGKRDLFYSIPADADGGCHLDYLKNANEGKHHVTNSNAKKCRQNPGPLLTKLKMNMQPKHIVSNFNADKVL